MSAKKTGIFLPRFQGQRLADFPMALAGILDSDRIRYYDGVYDNSTGLDYVKPVSEEILMKVHSRQMVESVKSTADFEAASYSAGATVQAAEEIKRGKLNNAFVFTGFGDHHAGRDFYGGMCYFNGAALAIAKLRERGMKKFALIDTDSHHADGTRDIFYRDKDVLHVCFCFQDYSDDDNNVDVAIPSGISDDDYIQKIENRFISRVKDFSPELLFWEFGYDATRGEYGDKGLTRDCHLRIAAVVKSAADAYCDGRLITILCGGSRRDLATYIIPKIIAVLAELRPA